MELDIRIRILTHKEEDGSIRLVPAANQFNVQEFSVSEPYREARLSAMDEIRDAVKAKLTEISARRLAISD